MKKRKDETKKFLGLFLAFAVTVTTVFSPASVSAAAGTGEENVPAAMSLPADASGDVGQYAEVSSSGTTGDRDLNTINMSSWEPVGNTGADGENVPANQGWGNWGLCIDRDEQWNVLKINDSWVQYDWTEPVTTDWMQIYWWDDNGGLAPADTLTIQYKDNTQNDSSDGDGTSESDDGWKNVTMKTDFSTARKLGQYNAIAFDQITATSIRLVMKSSLEHGANGIGICRWKVRTPITDEERDKELLLLPEYVDADFTLPATTFSGKPITWESGSVAAIKVDSSTAKVTKGRTVKTVKMTAKVGGKTFKEIYVDVAKVNIMDGVVATASVSNYEQYGCGPAMMHDGKIERDSVWNAHEGNGSKHEGLYARYEFSNLVELTECNVYWQVDGNTGVPETLEFKYLPKDASPDDAESWVSATKVGDWTAAPWGERQDIYVGTYKFEKTPATKMLRMEITEAQYTGEGGGYVYPVVCEWQVTGELAVDDNDQQEAEKVSALIEAIGTVEYTTACKEKINAARAAYDKLTGTQKLLIEDDVYEALAVAEQTYDDMEKADAVTKLIDDILNAPDASKDDGNGNKVVNVTEQNKDAVQVKVTAARTAYNNLTDAQKGYVTNYKLLTSAETGIITVNLDAQGTLNLLVEKIGAININDMSKDNIDDYKAAIEEAEALLETVKSKEGGAALIAGADGDTKTALDNLASYREKYDTLKSDIDAAKIVSDAILAIGTVADTASSLSKIKTAREAYKGLTDARKALVDADKLAALTAAETTYAGYVIAKIAAIPDTIAADKASRDAITAARKAYDELSDEMKAVVNADAANNVTKLTTAEETYKTKDEQYFTERTNIARSAAVSARYGENYTVLEDGTEAGGDERGSDITTVNDGNLVGAGPQDWSTIGWHSGGNGWRADSPVYLFLRWDEVKSIDSMRVLYYLYAADNADVPTSTEAEYLTKDGEWTKITGMTDENYAAVNSVGTKRPDNNAGSNYLNVVKFAAPVTTKMIRLKMTVPDGKAVGVGEWEVYGTTAEDQTGEYIDKQAGSSSDDGNVTSLTIDKESATMKVGDTLKLTATVVPSTATVTWTTSDASIGTVNQTGTVGTVEAKKKGDVTITATAGSKKVSCEIKVEEDGTGTVVVTGVSLSKSSLTLTEGGSDTLTATVLPNTANQAVTWKSGDESIAKVEGGKVTAVKAGNTTITATSTADPTKSASCTVTVNAKTNTNTNEKPITVSKITLAKKLVIGNGDKLTLKPKFTPANATDKGVKWTVDKKGQKVLKVTQKGKITADKKKTGTAKVTVTSTSNSNVKATIKVTVKKQPKKIKLKVKGMKKGGVTLKKNKTAQIKITYSPKNTGSLLTFKSSNKKVATVDENGKIKAIKKGKAKITVTTGNKKKATLKVTVK